MSRAFLLSISALFAFAASSALACPRTEHKIKEITLNSDGIVTRSIYVTKEADGQKGKRGVVKNIAVVRDMLQIEQGDRLVLNADPLAIDALFEVEVALEDKEYDELGVMSASYRVRETTYFTFGSIKYKSAEKTYLAKITSNYLGKGVYGRTCGEVLVSELVVTEPDQPSTDTPTIPSQPDGKLN